MQDVGGTYSVYWWDGASNSAKLLVDLPDFISEKGKQWKPEALLPLDRDTSGLRVLVLLDSAKKENRAQFAFLIRDLPYQYLDAVPPHSSVATAHDHHGLARLQLGMSEQALPSGLPRQRNPRRGHNPVRMASARLSWRLGH